MSVIILALASVLGGVPPHRFPARFYLGTDRYGQHAVHGLSCREIRGAHTMYVYERRLVRSCK